MRISATGDSARTARLTRFGRDAGFTLTELMVVLVIIGLLASAVVLTMPDPRGALVDEGEAFAARARAAQESAVAEMRDTALWVSPTGYGFERHDGEAWTAMGRPPFQDRQWPAETEVTVAQQDEGERTRVIFDATGLTDPLDLTLARDGQQVGVVIGADGTIRVQG